MLTIIVLAFLTLILSILFSIVILKSSLNKWSKFPIILMGIVIIFIILWIIFSGILCTPRECFSAKMKSSDRKRFLDLLRITGKVLDDANIKWSLSSGNLLAVYRDNKLILPWDDDMDISLYNKDVDKGLKILKDKLSTYGCNISQYDKDFYKVYFKNYGKSHYSTNFNHYRWPFIDIFTCDTTPKNQSNNPLYGKALKEEDLPLKKMIVEGIPIHVPTRGNRSREGFRKKDLLTQCVDCNWDHKNEWPCFWPFNCKGKIKVSCSSLRDESSPSPY